MIKSTHRRPSGSLAALVLLLLASCRHERVVFETRSEFQEIVVTEQLGEIRTLRFGSSGPVQSRVEVGRPERLHLPYTRAVMAGLAFVRDPARILVVGLGGGSIPMFLHHKLPTAQIDVVELDGEVARVAREWFGVREDDRLRIVVADGRRFIEEVTEPYDLIVLDAYDERAIPKALVTLEFLTAARDATKPDGVVVANVFGPKTNRLYGSMVVTYRSAFEELYLLDIPDSTNWIFAALPSARGSSLDLPSELAELSRRLGDDLELGSLARSGDARVSDGEMRGTVLTD